MYMVQIQFRYDMYLVLKQAGTGRYIGTYQPGLIIRSSGGDF